LDLCGLEIVTDTLDFFCFFVGRSDRAFGCDGLDEAVLADGSGDGAAEEGGAAWLRFLRLPIPLLCGLS
jgi:hypothetical protein